MGQNEHTARRAINVLLPFSTALAIGCLFWRVDEAPPFLDFDVAAEAIFVWSYLHSIPLEFPFNGSQSTYIYAFEAERLPFSILMAFFVWISRISPHELELFFKIAGGISAILFAIVSGLFVKNETDQRWLFRLFLIGATCSYAPLVLLARNGVCYNIFACVLFWLVVYLINCYADTSNAKYLYRCSIVAVACILFKYTPMAVLPLTALILLVAKNKLCFALKDKHVYLSLVGTVIGATTALLLFGNFIHGDIDDYLAKLHKFSQLRQSTFSIEGILLAEPFTDKLTKLTNQHLIFARDNLGDKTREDEMFVLGDSNPIVFVLAALALLGAIRATRRRHREAIPFAAITISVLGVFLTLSFPEGRYILCVVPCYFYFAWFGLNSCLEKCPKYIPLIAALLIIFQTGINQRILFGPYNKYMHEYWSDREGFYELATQLPPAETNTDDVISMLWPRTRKLWLYYAMLTGLRVSWLTEDEFLKELQKWRENPTNKRKRFFFYETKKIRPRPKMWIAQGFEVTEQYRTRFQNERRILLQYPPK